MKTRKAPSRLKTAPRPETSDKIKDAQGEADKAQDAVARAANNEIVSMAVGMPHGQAKKFLDVVGNLRKIKEEKKAIGKRERGERASLKEMKVNLKAFDHTFKLSEMEPEDVRSFEATVGLYKETMSMPLSEHQQVIKKELAAQREAARDAMIDASGGDTGKEIGSGSQYGVTTDDEEGNIPVEKTDMAAPKVPARNETFKAAAPVTH